MKPARPGYRLIACDGAAHSNPHIDNCGECAPRWGAVERLKRETIAGLAGHGRANGPTRELAAIVNSILSIVYPNGKRASYGLDIKGGMLADFSDIMRVLVDYGPDVREVKLTHCAASDITPSRCTVERIGTEDECRAYVAARGDDTWGVFRITGAMHDGARAFHNEGIAWTEDKS